MKRSFLALALILVLVVAISPAQAREITPNGCRQGDLVEFITQLQNRTNTTTLSHANVHKHADASPTLDIGTTFSYSISGYTYSKAASDTCGELTASAQSTGTAVLYLFSVNSAGTATCTKGTAVSYLTTPDFPEPPSGYCPFGALKVTIAPTASTAFTLGTTAFNWSVATCTAYSLKQIPLDITDF